MIHQIFFNDKSVFSFFEWSIKKQRVFQASNLTIKPVRICFAEPPRFGLQRKTFLCTSIEARRQRTSRTGFSVSSSPVGRLSIERRFKLQLGLQAGALRQGQVRVQSFNFQSENRLQQRPALHHCSLRLFKGKCLSLTGTVFRIICVT